MFIFQDYKIWHDFGLSVAVAAFFADIQSILRAVDIFMSRRVGL